MITRIFPSSISSSMKLRLRTLRIDSGVKGHSPTLMGFWSSCSSSSFLISEMSLKIFSPRCFSSLLLSFLEKRVSGMMLING